MLLITGANGHLGTATIDFLLDRIPKEKIAGLVRSEEKGKELKEKGVELKIGDYFDRSSLARAFKGINTLLLISTSTMEKRVEQHTNVIEEAANAGVGHIIYTSMVMADKRLSPLAHVHAETEKVLDQSGIPVTLSRHTFYTEFFPMYLGNALETGQWVAPSDGQKVNFAYRTEMAEALANILADPVPHRNKTYELTSGQAYTFEELANILSEASGKKISYSDIEIDKYVNHLQEAGLPEEIVGMAKLSSESVCNGALDITTGDLEELLGCRPKTTEEFIREFVK